MLAAFSGPGGGGSRAAGAEPGEQPVEHAGVAAASVGAGVSRRGQEGVGRGLDCGGVTFAQGMISRSFAPPPQMYRITCPSRPDGGRLPAT